MRRGRISVCFLLSFYVCLFLAVIACLFFAVISCLFVSCCLFRLFVADISYCLFLADVSCLVLAVASCLFLSCCHFIRMLAVILVSDFFCHFIGLMQNWWLTKQLFFSQVGRFKKYDVCLSYCDDDERLVEKICSMLQKVHTQIVIHRKQFTYNHAEVWQEEIFDIMIQSRKWVSSLGLPSKRVRSRRLDPKADCIFWNVMYATKTVPMPSCCWIWLALFVLLWSCHQ